MANQEEILNLLSEVKFLGIMEISKKLKISRRYTRKLIDDLYLQKKVKITGPGCNPLYYRVKIYEKFKCPLCGQKTKENIIDPKRTVEAMKSHMDLHKTIEDQKKLISDLRHQLWVRTNGLIGKGYS